MDGYDRLHPDTGYGLARHAPRPRAPAPAAPAPAVDPGAPAPVAPAAPTPRPSIGERAQAMLSQRHPEGPAAPRPAAPAATSLAAPATAQAAATAAPPSSLAPPPPPPAIQPNQWGIDFSQPMTGIPGREGSNRPAGWNDTMETLANPNASDRGNIRGVSSQGFGTGPGYDQTAQAPQYRQGHYVPGDLGSPMMRAMQADPDNRALGNGQSWNELLAELAGRNAAADKYNAEEEAAGRLSPNTPAGQQGEAARTAAALAATRGGS